MSDQESGNSRKWLEDLLYYMWQGKYYDYCYALHNVEIVTEMQPFAFCGSYPVPASAVVDPNNGQLVIRLYWPIVSRLSIDAQVELLQHETLHILEGHLSPYGVGIIKMFGPYVANIAMDIYVNQKISIRHLDSEGLIGVRLDDYKDFPPNLSSFEYAKLLVRSGVKEPPHQLIIISRCTDGSKNAIPTDPLAGTSGQPGDHFTGKGQAGVMIEVLDISEEEAIIAGEKTRAIISNVAAALEAGSHKSRGLGGADQNAFLTASKRESEVPWSMHLRALETKHRNEFPVPTRRRPSRRHPTHMGRVRRSGLDVAFLVDTSGSMGANELKLVDPELRGLHARGAHITVIHCDAKVTKVHVYSPYEPLRTIWPMPNFLVGFTDGWGGIEKYKAAIIAERGRSWWELFRVSQSDESPDGIRTLWLLPEGCLSPSEFTERVVPWGKVITVKRDPS